MAEGCHFLTHPANYVCQTTRTKLTKTEKQEQINILISEQSGKVTPNVIVKCYNEIVNPGFVGKASHSLQVCFDSDAKYYINECFRLEDKKTVFMI